MGSLAQELRLCKYNRNGDQLAGQGGCYGLEPVFQWIERCIISIFLVFMIAFLPLFLQGPFFFLFVRSCSPNDLI